MEQFLPSSTIGVISAAIGAIAGAGLTFLVSYLNGRVNDAREFKRSVQHIYSEILNADRHYMYSSEENLTIRDLSDWRKVVQLGKCRFYGQGLGTFESSALRLFQPDEAEQILDFMLVIRNNDYYIDQAIRYSPDDEKDKFDEICSELFARFEQTRDQANSLKSKLRSKYSRQLRAKD